ncbi:MAG TPA: DNRLRE domain-containing protein [Gaiellaceae bacterium]|nr:DNRLRE domain-containing protein [Gaiellaceae bacterium]
MALTVGVGSIPLDPKPESALRAFRAEADTYVSAARPEANFGRSRTLRADATPRETIYLRFRLRELSGEVTSVVLLLHARTEARTSFQVRPVGDDDWTERELTFETAPEASLRYAASKPVRRGIWSAVDVTSFVDEGGGRVSLAVTTRGTRRVVFGSLESRRGPRLVVRTKREKDEGGGKARGASPS